MPILSAFPVRRLVRRGSLVATTALLAASASSGASGMRASENAEQQLCPPIITGGNQTDLRDPPKVMRETCQVQPDSYVLVHNDIKIHGKADVSGHCRTQAWNGTACGDTSNTYRAISQISVAYDIPGQPSNPYSGGSIFGKNPATGAWSGPSDARL